MQPGTVLQGRYSIGRVLGRGGMGVVYHASHTILQTSVAVKELSLHDVAAREEARLRFEREARTLASLQHPGIVRVTDCFEENGKLYLVMDFVDGETLEAVATAHPGGLPFAAACPWILAVLDILEFLHGQLPPLVHRDLKPANIMVDRTGRLSLVDFGIARTLDSSATASGFVALTSGYAPLEQYGTGPIDARADIYAMGATIYHLLTRQIPRPAPDRVTDPALEPPSGLNPSVPAALDDIVLRMLAPLKQDRPSSVMEIRSAIQALAPGWKAAPASLELASTAPSEGTRPPAGTAAPAGRVPPAGTGSPAGRVPPAGTGSPAGSAPLGTSDSTGASASPSGTPPTLVDTSRDSTGERRPAADRSSASPATPSRTALPAAIPQPALPAPLPVEQSQALHGLSAPTLVSPRAKTSELPDTRRRRRLSQALVLAAILAVAAGAWLGAGSWNRAWRGIAPPPRTAGIPGTPSADEDAPAGLRPLGANDKGFQEAVNEKDGSVLIRVPGGSFTMGAPGGLPDELPTTRVKLRPYWIGKTPITIAQFRRFAQATGYHGPAHWLGYARTYGEQAPVLPISYEGTLAYCRWAGLRLPTEAEWEFAARGPEESIYPWGNDWDASRCGSSVSGLIDKPAPVGSFPAGASPFGCLDMVGSVWQRCSSRCQPYPYSATDGREDPTASGLRILRGGCFRTTTFRHLTSTFRVVEPPRNWHFYEGFRGARNVDPP